MNRKTKTLLLSFLALLALVVLILAWPGTDSHPGLNLPGWSQGHKVEKAEENGPFDRVEITTGEGRAVFKREGKELWSMTPPAGARADRFKIRQILEAFREDLTSVLSSPVTDEGLVSFGLHDDSLIRVTLFKGEEKAYDLEIGGVQKPVKGHGEGDTFVRFPDGDTAYRIIEKDLRRPFDKGLKGLRDRRVFPWESKDVTALQVHNPAAVNPVDQQIELRSEMDEAGDKRVWHFVTPARFKAGDLKSYAGTVASLYAQEYLDELPDGVAFGPDAFRLTVTLADGGKASFEVSAAHDGAAYLRVEGMSGFAKVSKYTAESIRKTVADFRDKTVFGISREQVLKVTIADGGDVFAFTRVGDGYRALVPTGMPLGHAQVDTLLRDIETLKAKDLLTGKSSADRDTGLSRPVARVTVTTMDGVARTLRIGGEVEGQSGTFYGSMSGSTEVFSLAKWALDKVRKTPSDMRNKKVFDFPSEAVTSVTIRHRDETLTLTRGEAAGDGDPQWKGTNGKEKKILAADKVRTLVSTLAGLTVKDFAGGRKMADSGLAKGQALLVVTVKLHDGSTHVLRVSEQKSGTDPYGASTTEKDFKGLVFTLNQYQVQHFGKRLAEL